MRYRSFLRLCPLLVLLAWVPAASSVDMVRFYQRGAEGWFWYAEAPPEPQTPEPESPQPVPKRDHQFRKKGSPSDCGRRNARYPRLGETGAYRLLSGRRPQSVAATALRWTPPFRKNTGNRSRSSRISGHVPPESAVTFDWNHWSRCVGIRTFVDAGPFGLFLAVSSYGKSGRS